MTIESNLGLAWPVALLLTVPPVKPGRLAGGVLPAFAAVGALLLLALTVPQELLTGQRGLADWLLLPTEYASNALRILYLCLLMLTIFLSIAGCVQLATEHLCAPAKHCPKWLPYGLLAGLILTQIGDTAALWRMMELLQPWLIMPVAGIAVICLLTALIRRRKS